MKISLCKNLVLIQIMRLVTWTWAKYLTFLSIFSHLYGIQLFLFSPTCWLKRAQFKGDKAYSTNSYYI